MHAYTTQQKEFKAIKYYRWQTWDFYLCYDTITRYTHKDAHDIHTHTHVRAHKSDFGNSFVVHLDILLSSNIWFFRENIWKWIIYFKSP